MTLGQQVYEQMRERLVAGEWLPEKKLTLRGLASELGTSVQPVREAVQRLVAEKALLLKPNHSVIVPSVVKSELDEIWNLRLLLEGDAARLCIPNLTRDDLRRLDESVERLRIAYGPGGDPRGRIPPLTTIAQIIAERSASHFLSEQIFNLRVRVAPYYAAAMAREEGEEPEFITFTIRLLDEFIQALRRRDAQSAMDLRRADLYTYQQYVYRRLGIA